MSGNNIYWGERRTKSNKKVIENQTLKNIQIGFVRATNDPQRMGRLQVWIPDFGPDIEEVWITVSYASPFAGTTNIDDAKVNDKTENGSQTSYGFWAIPPDIGNQVLVCFINGDQTRGYWFGCIYPQNMDHMIPAIGSSKSTDDTYNKKFAPYYPPVTEYNKKDETIDPKKPLRPVYTALADGLLKQGLEHDGERGVSSSSARREDTSLVQGWLTPGGNSITLDDNPANAFMRLRTKSGTQIMVSETSGFIYMITKDGNTWMELSDGAMEVYSAGPISFRSEDDINIRADKNINFDAGGDLNIHAGGNIGSFSAGNTDMAAAGAFTTQASGKASHSAGGDMAIAGGGNTGISAGGNAVLEAGGSNIRNGAQILDNSGGGGASAPSEAQFKEASSIGASGPTICSRYPTHEPYHHPINTSDNVDADGMGIIVDADGNVTKGDITPDDTPVRNISGYKVSDKVNACIYQAAQKTGVPYANLMAIAAQESAFKAGAGASTSSAKGLFQFTSGTWAAMYKKYGPNGTAVRNPTVTNNPYDACSNALLGAYYYKENQAGLNAAGLPSGPTEVYASHFLGSGGGKTFLRGVKSNPDAPVSSSVSSSAIRANKSIFYKAGGQLRTNKEVYNLLYSKVGGTVPQWEKYRQSTTDSHG